MSDSHKKHTSLGAGGQLHMQHHWEAGGLVARSCTRASRHGGRSLRVAARTAKLLRRASPKSEECKSALL